MTIKKIGNIALDNPIWWENYDNMPTVLSETASTIDGGVIVYEQPFNNLSKNFIIQSLDNSGWQTIATKEALKTLVENSIGTTSTITTTDDEVINIRFRHEAGAVEFSRVVEAKLSKYYKIKLNVARV